MSRIRYSVAFGLLFVAVTAFDASADEPEVLAVSEEALVELGEAVAKADSFKDNYFQYEARVAQLVEVAQPRAERARVVRSDRPVAQNRLNLRSSDRVRA